MRGNCSSFIGRFIHLLPKGKIFTTRECLIFGKRSAVDQALYRLVKRERIVRLARGVFMKVHWSETISTISIPSIFEIVQAKAKSFGKQIALHGSQIAQDLGLITSINSDSKQHIFAITGKSSSFQSGSNRVYFHGISAKLMHQEDTKIGQAIRAFCYMHKNHCQIPENLEFSQRWNRLDRELAYESKPWMPAWLSNWFPFAQRERGPAWILRGRAA